MISNIFVFNSGYFPLNNQIAFWNRLKSSNESRDLENWKKRYFPASTILLSFLRLESGFKCQAEVAWPNTVQQGVHCQRGKNEIETTSSLQKLFFVFVRENQVFTQKLLYQQEITCDMNIELCLLSAFCCFSNIPALKFR